MNSTILLIHCSDQPGLIYKITQVIFEHNLNIISNGEFVERNFNHFFMRTEFSGTVNEKNFLQKMKAFLPADAFIKLTVRKKRDVAILVTKEHHCLSDLLTRNAF